jgi:hypothetical protein
LATHCCVEGVAFVLCVDISGVVAFAELFEELSRRVETAPLIGHTGVHLAGFPPSWSNGAGAAVRHVRRIDTNSVLVGSMEDMVFGRSPLKLLIGMSDGEDFLP